ncbi:hypothetical protein SLEP1_g18884 [Rubroshorea leprosula]|uniref:Uncharacterized protein n=1 Tax=Rubroshorea leprosula TaxID=152421 RepID=A0AAV5J9L9_9ROSI|nr:hypothetical protein SLEP1_g18884 [Rubroshorea leprosula]
MQKPCHSCFSILFHIRSNHCDFHLFVIILNAFGPLSKALQSLIKITVVVTRNKSFSHHSFHLFSSVNKMLSISTSTKDKLIPPHHSVISKFHHC